MALASCLSHLSGMALSPFHLSSRNYIYISSVFGTAA